MGISEFNPPKIGKPAGKPKPGKPAPAKSAPALRWSERLGLGVDEIDEQHRRLLDYCNDLIEAVREGRGQEAVTTILARLRDYTVTHFTAEERYMKRVGYPELEKHRTAHADLVRRVKDYQRQLYQMQPPAPAEVRAFLKDWLITHILGEDLKIAAHVRTQSAGTAGGEKAVELVAEPPSRPEGD